MSIWDQMRTNDAGYMARTTPESDFKERLVACIIGLLALFLAFGVAVLDRVLEPICARASISHYFLEPFAGTFFVMTLTFVGAFMVAYRGENRCDGYFATIGGIGALILAFFPTDGLGCGSGALMDLRPAVVIEVPAGFEPGDLVEGERYPDEVSPGQLRSEAGLLEDVELKIGSETTQFWHYVGAGVLFLVLLYFAGLAFPRIDEDDRDATGALKLRKRIRNALYYIFFGFMILGFLMVLFPGTGIAQWLSGLTARLIAALPYAETDFAGEIRPVYHGELIAFAAFGLSWLLKGRFYLRFGALR